MIDPAVEKFIQANLHESIEKVVFKARNQLAVDPVFVVDQINGRKKVAKKIPAWSGVAGLQFPSVLSFEQCSSERTARYKAQIASGESLVDVTGGFGVDSFFLSQGFTRVDYVEKNAALLEVAQANFKQLGVKNISFFAQDGLAFLQEQKEKVDWIYVDPARRNSTKGKVFLVEDCEPDIVQCLDLLLSKANRILVKFSPMLDLDEVLKKVRGLAQITVLSVKNECKELLVEIDGVERVLSEVKITAVDLTGEAEEESYEVGGDQRKQVSVAYNTPKKFIYEPNKSILKAGIQHQVAQDYGLAKLAANSNFFTAEVYSAAFPGRIFLKKESTPGKEKKIKKYLPKGKANVIARNYPLNAAQIYQQFKITSGGSVYLLATSLENGEKTILVCERLK